MQTQAIQPTAAQSPILKVFAKLISWILHPVFVPVYVIWFLVYLHPTFFSGFTADQKWRTIIICFLNLVFFPLFSVVLLKAVGFIESIFLRTQKDRIIPYIACGIFFFWAYTVFKQQELYPRIIPAFILGIFLASVAGLLSNIYFKISMHALGMGGWLGIFAVIISTGTMVMSWPFAIVLLLTGLVCSSRMLLSSHTQKDIYIGLLGGFISQLIAAYIVL